MGVQAGAARRVMSRSPDQAAEVLSGIEASSRQPVVELQQLLGFLRSETGATGLADLDGSAAVAPRLPGLSRLDEVVSQLNEAGLGVTFDRVGTPAPLSASVDLSAFRIAQEASPTPSTHGGVGTIATVTLTSAPTASSWRPPTTAGAGPTVAPTTTRATRWQPPATA